MKKERLSSTSVPYAISGWFSVPSFPLVFPHFLAYSYSPNQLQLFHPDSCKHPRILNPNQINPPSIFHILNDMQNILLTSIVTLLAQLFGYLIPTQMLGLEAAFTEVGERRSGRWSALTWDLAGVPNPWKQIIQSFKSPNSWPLTNATGFKLGCCSHRPDGAEGWRCSAGVKFLKLFDQRKLI